MNRKILIYRNRFDSKIVCIDDCPNYTKQRLDEIVQEFNASGDQTVEVKILKENSLELYLLQHYFNSKINRKEELDACINTVYMSAYRLRNLCNALLAEFAPKEEDKCNL